MQTPEIGKKVRYQAKHNGPIVISPEDSGAIMVYIPYTLVNAGFNFSGIYAACIAQKDGTPSTQTIVNLAKIFRLESVDDFVAIQELEVITDGLPEFELAEWSEEEYNGRVTVKPRWINALGGGFRKKPLDESGKKKFISQMGSRLKSILANVDHSEAEPETESEDAVEKQEEKSSGTPARRAGGGSLPGRRSTAAQERTSTQDETWDAWDAKNPKPKEYKGDWINDKDGSGDKFWAFIETIVPKRNGELSIQDWGKVRDALDAE